MFTGIKSDFATNTPNYIHCVTSSKATSNCNKTSPIHTKK